MERSFPAHPLRYPFRQFAAEILFNKLEKTERCVKDQEHKVLISKTAGTICMNKCLVWIAHFEEYLGEAFTLDESVVIMKLG